MFNIQHTERVQIRHVSYIRKPRLSGTFLGNERVRINEVSLYMIFVGRTINKFNIAAKYFFTFKLINFKYLIYFEIHEVKCPSSSNHEI